MSAAENQPERGAFRGEDSAMKWHNRTAQGFSPGLLEIGSALKGRPMRTLVLVDLHKSYRRNLAGERTFVGRPFRAVSRWHLTQG